METEQPKPPVDPKRERIRLAVRFFYDAQKLRIAMGNRVADPDSFKMVPDKKDPEKLKKVKKTVKRSDMDKALLDMLTSIQRSRNPEEQDIEIAAPPTLEEEDREYLQRQQYVLHGLEADTLDRISKLLKDVPIAKWLIAQKGLGPTLAGVIVSEIDISRSPTVSALWAYCGLHVNVESGLAMRRQRGVKANWNSFLKSKLSKVLADCFIKANSPWRAHYDSYKMRKTNQQVPVCMLCNGSGKMRAGEDQEWSDDAPPPEERDSKKKSCSNCGGTGGPAPWGRSAAHRDVAAKRYMVKMFLMELWQRWRTLEGLPVTEPYAVVALGREHGDHGGMNLRADARMNPRTGREWRPAPRVQIQPR